MTGRRIILWFALTIATAPCSAAELSAGSTPHYSFGFGESDSDIANNFKGTPLTVDKYRNAFQQKFDLKKESPFTEKNNTHDPDFFGRQFGSNYSFSIRTPSNGIFDLKSNNKDDFTDYRNCLSKTLNYTDSSRCNIEILLGKKFNL